MKRRMDMDIRNTTPIDGVATPQSNYEKYKDMFTDKHDLITMENFYSLLVAEMQNQDPLEPTSNTEFISQMASFTALSAQQDAFNVQQQQYANSLIGKTVTVSKGDGQTETGMVAFVTSGDNPQVSINGNKYNLSAISQVHDDGSQKSSGIGDYGAFAAGILGKRATVQAMDATGATVVDEGVVSSLEIDKGNVRVVVNGYAYDATDVLKVTENAAAAAPAVQAEASDSDQTAANSGAAVTTNGTNAAAGSTPVNMAAVKTDAADIADDDDDTADGNADIYELFE